MFQCNRACSVFLLFRALCFPVPADTSSFPHVLIPTPRPSLVPVYRLFTTAARQGINTAQFDTGEFEVVKSRREVQKERKEQRDQEEKAAALKVQAEAAAARKAAQQAARSRLKAQRDLAKAEAQKAEAQASVWRRVRRGVVCLCVHKLSLFYTSTKYLVDHCGRQETDLFDRCKNIPHSFQVIFPQNGKRQHLNVAEP